jgi:hypothetical protein
VSNSGFDVVNKDTIMTIVDKNMRGREARKGGKVRRSVIRFILSLSPKFMSLHVLRYIQAVSKRYTRDY